MHIALETAAKGVGRTSPNPAVGAVIVRNGRVIAKGWHQRAGLPHAEIEALRNLKDSSQARGATLYVTLEPCSTHGRTPPCTEALIQSGFKRVVVGAVDPNPRHAGRGLNLLRNAGITVTAGVMKEACTELNRAFNHWIVTKRPWVIAKAALSLDGKLTRPCAEGQWLTNEESRADAHQLRAQVDAILIGAGTLRTDNPQLTVRGVANARQPWRVVVSQSGRLPKTAHLFTDSFKDRTLVYRGASLKKVLRDLGQRDVTSVLIEGGGTILGEAFDQHLVNQVRFYFAPILSGGPDVIGGRGAGATSDAIRLAQSTYRRIGNDLCLDALVTKNNEVSVS